MSDPQDLSSRSSEPEGGAGARLADSLRLVADASERPTETGQTCSTIAPRARQNALVSKRERPNMDLPFGAPPSRLLAVPPEGAHEDLLAEYESLMRCRSALGFRMSSILDVPSSAWQLAANYHADILCFDAQDPWAANATLVDLALADPRLCARFGLELARSRCFESSLGWGMLSMEDLSGDWIAQHEMQAGSAAVCLGLWAEAEKSMRHYRPHWGLGWIEREMESPYSDWAMAHWGAADESGRAMSITREIIAVIGGENLPFGEDPISDLEASGYAFLCASARPELVGLGAARIVEVCAMLGLEQASPALAPFSDWAYENEALRGRIRAALEKAILLGGSGEVGSQNTSANRL